MLAARAMNIVWNCIFAARENLDINDDLCDRAL